MGCPPQRERLKAVKLAYRRREFNAVAMKQGARVRSTSQATDVSAELDNVALNFGEVGSWVFDLAEGEFLPRADCWQLLGVATGTPNSKWTTRSSAWCDRIHPADRAVLLSAIADCSAGHASQFDVDYRMRHTNGDYYWFNSRGKPTGDAGNGQFRYIAGVLQNIHRRKTAELQSRENEEKFLGIFQNTRRLVALLTPRGKNLITNPVGYAFTGLTPEETGALYFWEGHWWLSDDDRDRIKAAVERAADGETVQFEIGQRAANGEIFISDFSITPVRGPDNEVQFLLPEANDITALKRAERERDYASLRSELAVESAGIGIWEWNAVSNASFYTARTCEILDVAPEEITTEDGWLSLIHPDDVRGYRHSRAVHLAGKTALHQYEIRIRQKDGSYKWVHDLGKVIERDETGLPRRMVGTLRDIDQRKKMEAALLQREDEVRTLVDHSPDGIIRYDSQLRCTHINPAARQFLKNSSPRHSDDEALFVLTDASGADIFPRELNAVFASGKPGEFEAQYNVSPNRPHWMHVRITPEFGRDGAVATVLVVTRDVTEAVTQRENIHRLAYSDTLTGLPNRAHFNEQFAGALAASKLRSGQSALIIIDIDHFKDVNDTLGHSAGDILLRDVAVRLRAELQPSATLARLGGDEFGIVLKDVQSGPALEGVASDLLHTFKKPFRIASRDLFISCSMGMACFPADGMAEQELFARADAALYEAKARGRGNFQFYDETLTEKARQRLSLSNDLRAACANNELQLDYQPKVDIKTGHLVGAEALLRWRHPELGLLPPNVFIPIAEDNGVIVEIGHWVIERAAQTAATLNKVASNAPIKIALNLSARQFAAADLIDHFKTAIRKCGCRPEWLEAEITESLLLHDGPCVQHVLGEIRDMGISVAIDDFGTGQSALAYLTRFPIDVLKIDRSFVTGMGTDERGVELVKAFISIASALGMQTVAEGIETQAQADALRSLGCGTAQGYFFGKPMSLADFTARYEAEITMSKLAAHVRL